MVLFKRKPIELKPRPAIADENVEVWMIGQTGEVFTNYEEYLERMDFYKMKKFTDEISGTSSLTFFEAQEKENSAAAELNAMFPANLKGPVLRKVQFRTTKRLDHMVDDIFDELKKDFFVGERVSVSLDDGQKLNGVVRDKVSQNEIKRADGSIERRAMSRYFVALDNRPFEEAIVDDEHIFRDRKFFTKAMLRAFIRASVDREAWKWAPWLVKEELAVQYHIDQKVPRELQREYASTERRLAQETIVNLLQRCEEMRDLKPSKKLSDKAKEQHEQLANQLAAHTTKVLNEVAADPEKRKAFLSDPRNRAALESFLKPRDQEQTHLRPMAPPPPVKFPTEDLDLDIDKDVPARPTLRYFQDPGEEDSVLYSDRAYAIRPETVGLLLETWQTLNVYCEIFQLDSFTFDDFVEALRYDSDEMECELLVEIHCAILKLLVDKGDNGSVNITLPEIIEEEDEEEEEEEEEEKSPSPEPVTRSRRTTRGSLAKDQAKILKREAEEEAAAAAKIHLAEEMLESYPWIQRLRKRDFRFGGWETIIVGLLYQLSMEPRQKDRIEPLLKKLAPVDKDATQEVAREQYRLLDVNDRAQILQILCMLTTETKTLRNYLETCSEEMTTLRKKKIDLQRERKALIEDLKQLEEERIALQPTDKPEDVKMEDAPQENGESKGGSDTEEDPNAGRDGSESENESQPVGRSLRRGSIRAQVRQEKRQKAAAAAAAPAPKISPKLKRILTKIENASNKIAELEAGIVDVEEDLRQNDCPRTRCLGKDRFWNRYYWFERNGMPHAGMPDSSTADNGYANGLIWVQGPDDIEREGFIEPTDQVDYLSRFSMTIPDRKKLEEGKTSLRTARDWAFIENPDDIGRLIDWLDPRGHRELKLRKELLAQQDKIEAHMQARLDYLAGLHDDEDGSAPPARISTRTKTYASPDGDKSVLKWHNGCAVRETGHLHSMEPGMSNSAASRKRKREAAASSKDTEKATEKKSAPATRSVSSSGWVTVQDGRKRRSQ